MRRYIQLLPVLAACTAFACGQEETGGQLSSAETSTIAGNWAARLALAHHQADHISTDKDSINAAQSLAELALDSARPDQEAALMLAQEAAARSASLYIKSDRVRDARALIERGLVVSAQPTVGLAQLYMVLADCEQAEDNEVASRQALLKALSINQELFALELKNP